MTNQINKQSRDYFNRTALTNVLLVLTVFVVMDFFIFDYSQLKDYSIVFYIKLAVVGLYSLGNDKIQVFDHEEHLNLQAAFDFSGALYCLWFAIADFFFLGNQPSLYSSIFVVFSLFGWISFSAKIPFILREKTKSETIYTTVLWINKVIILLMIVLLLLIIINGSWEWKVLSPFTLIRG
jgi:hypothetical protein